MRLSFENLNNNDSSLFAVCYHDDHNPCNVLWHYHPECELVYVPQGSSRRQVGGHLSRYTDGDLVLIAPDIPHLNFNYQVEGAYEEIVVQFKLDNVLKALLLFPEFLKLAYWLKEMKTGFSFGPATRMALDTDLRSLLELPLADRSLLFLKILNKLSSAADFICLDTGVGRVNFNRTEEERINKACNFVKINYQSRIDYKEIADLTGLSQAAFCRFFRRHTKMSFTDFVNEFRIQKACQCIVRGYSAAEAAYSSGFNSVSHFNVTFKKIMKLTPSAYREKMM